ncbi:MAG: SsrA-binding protein SmpB [Acidimicrobiia bacterium]|nr:SsrA-binding protein SmpB [Acidimicrobiia bacterium]MYE74194.1 SsrA-binding protein SmpB [Acidimicrobiia bacterium]MYJ61701.1 SsrA-binding protein SmpB [Acidimicrobiia bacterium]
MAGTKPGPNSEQERTKVVATNRRARRDFEILDEYEAGLVLVGSEVKSLRESKVTLAESYARMADGELWLQSLHIAPYTHASGDAGHDPDRPKKLLLHRGELNRIKARLEQDRLTVVPLSLYFKQGRAKVLIGIARGRRRADKRQAIAEQDARREARREMGRAAKPRGSLSE